MNFLKISGLVIGTGTVAGGTGIYYSVNRNSKKTPVNVETNIASKKPASFSGRIDSVDSNHEQINNEGTENPSIFIKNDPVIIQSASDNSKNDQLKKQIHKQNKKTQFYGKLVFYKKTGTDNSIAYEARLMSETEYNQQKEKFDKYKSDENKKIIDISGNLDSGKARKKLKEIALKSSSMSDIKTKISENETELKEFLGDTIYENLKKQFNS